MRVQVELRVKLRAKLRAGLRPAHAEHSARSEVQAQSTTCTPGSGFWDRCVVLSV